jgi:TRAP transporter 4TM/12TM fusion protein
MHGNRLKQDEPDKLPTVIGRLPGGWRYVYTVIALGMAIFHVYFTSVGIISFMRLASVHLSFLLVLAFLRLPARKGLKDRCVPIYDLICAILSIIVGGYIFFYFEEFAIAGYAIGPFQMVLACLAILLVLEAGRRAVGIELILLIGLFLAYIYYGPYFPGFLAHKGSSFPRMLETLYLSDGALFGIPTIVSAMYIYVFILFGSLMVEIGMTDVIRDLAIAVTGRQTGGPAKVAVTTSSLFGMVSGAASANVATTGSFTIPMMIGIGYKPKFAGGCEAASSTGGQIMPPIMGAAAFVMAEFLGIAYGTVAISAVVCAILYYFSLFLMVHLYSKKHGITGIESDLTLIGVLRQTGYMLVPIIAIIYFLVAGFTPSFAAFFGIISLFLCALMGWSSVVPFLFLVVLLKLRVALIPSIIIFLLICFIAFFYSKHRLSFTALLTPKGLVRVCENAAYSILVAGLACSASGLIIGAVTITGIGAVLGAILPRMLKGNLPLLLVITMSYSLFLGMGLPTTAAYIVDSIILAPPLIRMGVPPLAAHMFIFYFCTFSSLTPPVAIAAFTATGLVGRGVGVWQVGGISMSLAIAGFIIPYIFIYNTVLLLIDFSLYPFLWILLRTVLILGLISIIVQGYADSRISLWEKGVYALFCMLLLIQNTTANLVGMAVSILFVLLMWRLRPKAVTAPKVKLGAYE